MDLKFNALMELNKLSGQMDNARVITVADQVLSTICEIVPEFDILHVCNVDNKIHISFDVNKTSGVFEVDPHRIVLSTDMDGVERMRAAYYKDDYLVSVERWARSLCN